ncbi:MAG TPA: hypothetical protein VE398_08185 [Acidobacteriota bacterium]|nr:hypothetical protein [Acidobacteriota bacterium]
MRHEPDFFGGQELVLVYVAKRLRDALALEKALDADALDYAVVPTQYTSGALFRSQRVGAFFYVIPQDGDRAREVMRARGFKPYVNTGEAV